MRRLRVLVCAYACSPVRGSEHGVGWGWCKAISRYHDVWVLTSTSCRSEIEQELARDPELKAGVHFVYVREHPFKQLVVSLHRFYPPLLLFMYRHWWQRQAYQVGLTLHREMAFDLVHQVTFVGFRCPGYLWKLDIPFVWGPIGGLENTHWRLLPLLGPEGVLYYGARNVVNAFHRRFRADPKKAFRRAAAIIAATGGNAKLIGRHYHRDSHVICEVGTSGCCVDKCSARNGGEPMRISWSGQHIGAKALPLLLRALARLPDSVPWRLDVLGDGPLTPKWKALAAKLGIQDRCTWHGWVPRSEAIAVMCRAHVFVITSLKDLTSSVLLEALAQGVPVICPDHCGFSDVVTPDCGIKLPIRHPRQLESDLAAALMHLASHENERRRLAQGALQRAQAFSWEEKAQKIDSIYRRAMGQWQQAHSLETLNTLVRHGERPCAPQSRT